MLSVNNKSAVRRQIVERLVCLVATCSLVMPLAFIVVVLPSITPFGGDAPQAQAATVHGKACTALTDADTQLQATLNPSIASYGVVDNFFRQNGDSCEQLTTIRFLDGSANYNLSYGLKNNTGKYIPDVYYFGVAGGGGGGGSEANAAGGGGSGGEVITNWKPIRQIDDWGKFSTAYSSGLTIPSDLSTSDSTYKIGSAGAAGVLGTNFESEQANTGCYWIDNSNGNCTIGTGANPYIGNGRGQAGGDTTFYGVTAKGGKGGNRSRAAYGCQEDCSTSTQVFPLVGGGKTSSSGGAGSPLSSAAAPSYVTESRYHYMAARWYDDSAAIRNDKMNKYGTDYGTYYNGENLDLSSSGLNVKVTCAGAGDVVINNTIPYNASRDDE